MKSRLRIAGVLLGLSLALLSAIPAQAASIVVSPQTVQPGGSVTISGDVLAPPDNHVPGELAQGPGQLTLYSKAFWGGTDTVPQGVNIPVNTDARFSTQMPIRNDAAPGDYTVTGRFAGGNIGATAHFSVAGAAPKSPAPAQSGSPATAQPGSSSTAQPSPAATQQPGLPATGTSVQLPSWWPAVLAGLLLLVLSPWAGIVWLWRRRV